VPDKLSAARSTNFLTNFTFGLFLLIHFNYLSNFFRYSAVRDSLYDGSGLRVTQGVSSSSRGGFASTLKDISWSLIAITTELAYLHSMAGRPSRFLLIQQIRIILVCIEKFSSTLMLFSKITKQCTSRLSRIFL